jgi:hypothetical protein
MRRRERKDTLALTSVSFDDAVRRLEMSDTMLRSCKRLRGASYCFYLSSNFFLFPSYF